MPERRARERGGFSSAAFIIVSVDRMQRLSQYHISYITDNNYYNKSVVNNI